MVRFKVLRRLQSSHRRQVSIPKWYDLKRYGYPVDPSGKNCFNSKMVRFKVVEAQAKTSEVSSFNSKMVRFKAME